MRYELTPEGKKFTAQLIKEDGYCGPLPVPFSDYCEMVELQSTDTKRVSLNTVVQAFAGFEMKPQFLTNLKEGFNSKRPILFYGPPGNGKTLVTELLNDLLTEPVNIPYAIEFNGNVIQIFDTSVHKNLEDGAMTMDEKKKLLVSGLKKRDDRWVKCRAPLVIAGTEFRVKDFTIPFSGKYEANSIMKANNGIFVIDDFGRQEDSPERILNQFIYPLESQKCIIRLQDGSRMIIPYKQRLFLSTNLNKEEIIDDAFNRRLLYQFIVDRPSDEMWKKIFVNTLRKTFSITDTALLDDMAEKVITWYNEDERVVRACDPRNLCIMLDATLSDGESLNLTESLMRNIYEKFPYSGKGTQKEYQ
jgi:SpoVK/Ycf46/Vps4 family AAA+-type ATPase